MPPYFYDSFGDKKLFNSLALSNLLSSYSHSRYYMAESAKGQDEANPTFLLATRAGQIDPPRPLEISRVGPKRTKLIWSKSTSVCESKVLGHRPHCCLQQFIIPLLCHFTIQGQENKQNTRP